MVSLGRGNEVPPSTVSCLGLANPVTRPDNRGGGGCGIPVIGKREVDESNVSPSRKLCTRRHKNEAERGRTVGPRRAAEGGKRVSQEMEAASRGE